LKTERASVPLDRVGRSGRLSLTFAADAGKTAIRDVYGEVPFKVTRIFEHQPSRLAQIVLMHTTAGLFGGDCTELSIHALSGSRVAITSQSSLKIHPRGDDAALQRIHLKVDGGAELHYYNDPMIPFAGSRLEQSLRIELAAGARFSFWDGFMAGRIARGEAWQFASMASDTRVSAAGELIFLDRFQIDPSMSHAVRAWAANDRCYVGTGLFFGGGRESEFCESLHEKFPEAGVSEPAPGLIVARAAFRQGVVFHAIKHYVAEYWTRSRMRGW
jgi:urease accessory protein